MKSSETNKIANHIFEKIKPKIDSMEYKELMDYFCSNFDNHNNLQTLLNDLYDRDGINPTFLYKVEADISIARKVIFYANDRLDKIEKEVLNGR